MLSDSINDIGLYSAIAFMIFASYLNIFASTNYPYYERSYKELYDVLFQYLTPPISRTIPDTLIIILSIYFIIKCFSFSNIIIKKFVIVIGMLYIFRVLLFTLTETPITNKFKDTCINKSTKRSKFIWFLSGITNSCVNNMFSGHAMIGVAIMMFVLALIKSKIEKYTVVAVTIGLLITLIWSRMHYTQDILVALFITSAWSLVILGKDARLQNLK